MSYPFADLPLARRLETAEGISNAQYVTAHARLQPECGATALEVAGAWCLFDGVGSPCTQTFGLGIHRLPMPAELDEIEAFFRDRGAEVHHEISPLADAGLWPLLHARGYEPFEFTSVMYRPVWPGLTLARPANPRLRVRIATTKAERQAWCRAGAEGWRLEQPSLVDMLADLMAVGIERPDAVAFLVEVDQQAAAAGILIRCGQVGILGGASTIPEFRKQGAQLALLEARLRYAADAGCDLAMMCTAPGSGSQRNAERHGFRIAYTRIKWRLDAGVPRG